MADAAVSFRRTTSNKLQECPKVDGQIVVLTDMPGVFYDALDGNGNLVRYSTSEFTYNCTGTSVDGANIAAAISRIRSAGIWKFKLNIVGKFGLDITREYQIELNNWGGESIIEIDFQNFAVISVDGYTPKLLYINVGGPIIISNLAYHNITVASGNSTWIRNSIDITANVQSHDVKVTDCKFSLNSQNVALAISASGHVIISGCKIAGSPWDNAVVDVTGSRELIQITGNVFHNDAVVHVNDEEVDPSFNNMVTINSI